jgi:hypothetical protein
VHVHLFKSLNVGLAPLLIGISICGTAYSQDRMTSNKLPLNAELVLASQFCSAKTGHYINGDLLAVGKAVCPHLEAALDEVFSGLTRIEKAPAAGKTSAQVVLIPRFVDVSVTQPLLVSSQRELVIFLEWTIQDAAGQTVWLQTVHGSSHNSKGWITKWRKRRTELIEGAASDLAQASAGKMSAAPELRGLVH